MHLQDAEELLNFPESKRREEFEREFTAYWSHRATNSSGLAAEASIIVAITQNRKCFMGRKSREKKVRRQLFTGAAPALLRPAKAAGMGLQDISEFKVFGESYSVTKVPKLHKYFGVDRLVSMLNELSIRFTQPEYLNDPYECHLTLDRHALAADFREFRKQLSPGISNAELDSAVEAAESQIIIDALLEYRRQRDNIGVLSLSEDPLQLLMWSHYGSEHAGVCVEFDVTKLMPNVGSVQPEQLSILRQVRYRQQKVMGLPRPDTIIEVLTTKSNHWSYEREWRMVRTLDMTRKVNERVHVVDFPIEAIKTVYLGAKFPSTRLGEVTKLAEAQGGSHIKFVKLDIAPHRFELRQTNLGDYGWKLLHREHHFGEAAHEALVCLPMDDDA